MKIGDWRRLTDYWGKHPPACELLEMQVGRAAARGPAAQPPMDPEAFAAEVAALGGE